MVVQVVESSLLVQACLVEGARGVVLLPPSLHLRDALREAERHVVHLGGHKAGGLQCRIDLTRAGYGFAALVRLAAQLRLSAWVFKLRFAAQDSGGLAARARGSYSIADTL